jgi:hypothetical protein
MSFKFEIVEKDKLVVRDTTIADVIESVILNRPKSEVYFGSGEIKKDLVFIYDQSSVNASASGLWSGDLSQCVDDQGAPFTKETFTTWASSTLGFKTATGGSVAKDNQILVNQTNFKATLGGVIDSTKEYFLDGIIDMGATQITVPTTGLFLKGYNFESSGLISSADNYTMFISESPFIGSGGVLGTDYYVSVTGANSKVYELYDATGFNAFEFTRINYIDCTSLGDIYDYRQGLEIGTGRFGGSPSLTLHGLWRGGYRVTTSIVRSLAGTMTEPLFKEGTLFQMNSRFLTDINVDLPTLAPLLDFQSLNFPNPNTLQLNGCEVTRNGVYNTSDTNITPNISASNLSSYWTENNGIDNTFVGGTVNNTAELETVINAIGDAVDLNGTFVASNLQHCDSPANGRFRHLGINPNDFTVNWDFIIDGKNNDNYTIFLLRLNGGVGIPDIIHTQTRTVNSLQGGRDVGIWNGQTPITLNQNDVIFWQIANLIDTDNCTLEIDSAWHVNKR